MLFGTSPKGLESLWRCRLCCPRVAVWVPKVPSTTRCRPLERVWFAHRRVLGPWAWFQVQRGPSGNEGTDGFRALSSGNGSLVSSSFCFQRPAGCRDSNTVVGGGRVYKPRLERVEKDQVLAVGGIHTLAPGAPLHQKLVMTWRLQTLQSRPFAHLPRLRKQREGHESCPITGGKERGCRCCCRKRHGDSSKRRSTVPV